jgi:hypothetical protein
MAKNVKWTNQGQRTGRPWHWATVYVGDAKHDFLILSPFTGSEFWTMYLYIDQPNHQRFDKSWQAKTRAALKKIVREEY